MKLKTIISLFLAGLLLSTTTGAREGTESPDDILIVVNRSLERDNVSAEELRAIFLKKRTHWSGGGRAVPLNAKNPTLRKQFQTRFLKMDSGEEYRYWEKEKITRGIVPPPEFSEPLKAVFKLKGAVGYVLRRHYIEGVVKIVHVVPADN